MIKFFYFFIIFIIISSCTNSLSVDYSQKSHCTEKSDCLKNEICEDSYCISEESKEAENSKTTFSFKLIPDNSTMLNSYYPTLITPIFSIKDLQINKGFALNKASKYIEISGIIKNNKNWDISYNLILYDYDYKTKYYAYSYQNNGETLYNFRVPANRTYALNVFPNDYFSIFAIDLGHLKDDRRNETINVDEEISQNEYYTLTGEVSFNINNEDQSPKKYSIYAYIDNNNSEKVVSNKFNCDSIETCNKFNLQIFKSKQKTYLKIKIDSLKNITFKYPLQPLYDSFNDININLGNLNKSPKNKFLFNDVCKFDFNNMKVKIKGNLGNHGFFEKDYNCHNDNCNNNTFKLYEEKENGDLYEGNYNVFIKSYYDSCYASKFLNIELIKTPSEINIELRKKQKINGILMSKDGIPLKGYVNFTRTDNSLSDFSTQVQSNENGEFEAELELAEYNVSIESINSDISYSNWFYLNQRVTINTNNLLYIVPRSYKIPVTLKTYDLKTPVTSAQVTMYLHNLKEIFPNKNESELPESYLLNRFITDDKGKCVVSIPIIDDDFLKD